MQAYAGTDIGCVRTMNQDGYFCSTTPIGPFPNLFIVADGMGGHQAGDYASRYAIETFLDYIRHTENRNLIRVMDEGIAEANRKVLEKSFENEELAGMGTTMVVAFAEDGQLYVANVGDSRLYVIQDGIHQITRDHSLVQEMVKMGEISEEEARNHPDKNIITRALGAEKTVDVDFFDLKLEEGCTILMCSDGLSNMVADEKIEEIISDPEADIDQKGSALLREANQNGGKDNIAIVLVEPFTNEVETC